MSKTGHYMRPATRPRLPGVVFAVVCNPARSRAERNPRLWVRRWGTAAVAVSYLRRGRWTPPRVEVVSTPEAMRATMERWASAHRVNWVVSPIATDTLTLSEWWSYAEGEGIVCVPVRGANQGSGADPAPSDAVQLTRLVCRGIPDIVAYRHRGRRWQWVSGFQYAPEGPGDEKPEGSPGLSQVAQGEAREGSASGSPAHSAARWLRFFTGLVSWWGENARAPFGHTVGALALGMVRSYIEPRTLCTHREAEVHTLEREASYGGRASVWYVGRVGHAGRGYQASPGGTPSSAHAVCDGPVVCVDVRSMYPYLLSARGFPVSLAGVSYSATPTECLEAARSFGCIARVTIRTRSSEYPVRADDRVHYPIGQFTTTLTGPELLALQGDGEIVKCHQMAIYRMGRPFASVANALLSARDGYRIAGNASGERFSKLLANNIGGKLAQKCGGWSRCTTLDGAERWGEYCEVPADGSGAVWYRYIAGHCWRYDPDQTGAGPYTFAFAYLTAYGRLMMRSLRARCPEKSVVSQDTDGLWVLPAGLAALQSDPSLWGEHPGALRVTDSASTGRWLTPRHYQIDGSWVLSGFCGAVVSETTGTVWDQHEHSIWGAVPRQAPHTTLVTVRESRLPVPGDGASVAPDGWVRPRYLAPIACDGDRRDDPQPGGQLPGQQPAVLQFLPDTV